MKAFNRIICWIVVSLALQCLVYLFLDKYYFAAEGNIKYTDVTQTESESTVNPHVNFSGSESDISLSDDLMYTAFFKNGVVSVVDTNTGTAKKNLSFSSGVQCLSYKWVPNSDILIIAEKLNGSQIKFYSYDADKQLKTEIYNYEDKRTDSVPAGKSVDMQISQLTGLLYVKVSYLNNSSSIYRIDRNETLTRISTYVRNIGSIAVASNDDQFAYEDKVSGRIRTNYSQHRIIVVPGTGVSSIIGTDGNDKFYIGNGQESVNTIYYGKLSQSTSAWQKISLGRQVDKNNIIIGQDSSVYVVDKNQGTVTDVKNNKNYNYQGSFIQISDGYIVYKSGNKIVLKRI
ncbi:MAG: hypothetical protein PHX70_08205 [Clostridium sp.]|nr:hypothetical protein [Clostridium sp.]